MSCAEYTQLERKLQQTNVDSLLLDKLTKISKTYNISYDELYKTIISQETTNNVNSAESTTNTVNKSEPEKQVDEAKQAEIQSTKTSGVPTLDRYKFDNLKKTLKELKELAEKNKVSGHGTKEKIIERIYATLYPSVKPVTHVPLPVKPIVEQKVNATEPKVAMSASNETLIQKCIEEKERIDDQPEKKDIGVDTSDLDMGSHYIHQLTLKTISPKAHAQEEAQTAAAAIFSKWSEIHDRDILLLLQTHQLPIQGTRRDWIQRLMEYYNRPSSTPKKEVVEMINDDESMVSRIDVKPSFLKCISKAVPLSFQQEKDERTGNVRLRRVSLQSSTIQSSKQDRMVRYVWIQDKNWVFREDESSYEFIGSIQDGYLMYMDIPYELLEMNDNTM